jgi:hypothetical protein
MMPYTLNEYYEFTNSTDTRVEVYSDNNTAAQLLAYHKQNNAFELRISDCINTDMLTLPMPDYIMQVLDEEAINTKKRIIITGIDAYLSLLNKQNVERFIIALYSRIDEGKLNVAYLISRNRFDGSKFLNPKFQNSLQVVHIGNDHQPIQQSFVNIVSQKWVQQGNNPTDWKALLEALGQFEPIGEYMLVLDKFDINQAGISDNILQLHDIYSVAEKYYKITSYLEKNVLESLILKCKESNIKPLDLLEKQFGFENTDKRYAVKRLLELKNDELWSAYLWFLKKKIDSYSYLAVVLSKELTKDNLLRVYVCDIATTVLKDINAVNFANERALAVKEIGNVADASIIEFIGKTKMQANETIACWLNCHTKAEYIEIVRRVSESDLSNGLPRIWHDLYPLLNDYLSDEYDYGSTDITNYFRDYRRLKIKNDVTEDFVKQALNFILPSDYVFRDAFLQELSSDNNTALLMVDGMGAEYFPLVLAMAKKNSLNIENAVISSVKLPSSTSFNSIYWDENRKLKPNIHEIDNISHDGAKKHEKCSPAHNIVATLAVFETIFNCVTNSLISYERVVVTADHGSSLLAVLAHKRGLTKTLSWTGKPQDWRYTAAPENMSRPLEFEHCYIAESNTTYWVVRGYNRLPKEGGKLSVHGGATLEECLVPVIVFSKASVDYIPKRTENQTIEQIVEKPDLDI